MSSLFSIETYDSSHYSLGNSKQYYGIFCFHGEGSFEVDSIPYQFRGNVILFLSPYQNFKWLGTDITAIRLLQFHGDYYCIEYHKKEVACNGLLFNNIYSNPHILVSTEVFKEIALIFKKVEREKEAHHSFSEAIIKSYIQLILALCSKEKSKHAENMESDAIRDKHLVEFQELLEKHYKTERSQLFYASKLAITGNGLSKKIKKEYGKTFTQLISERVILEAKKLLHLTYRSIKEIASELNFDDEFYFSRYFKKATGLSPLHYRERVGISIMAKKSMQ